LFGLVFTFIVIPTFSGWKLRHNALIYEFFCLQIRICTYYSCICRNKQCAHSNVDCVEKIACHSRDLQIQYSCIFWRSVWGWRYFVLSILGKDPPPSLTLLLRCWEMWYYYGVFVTVKLLSFFLLSFLSFNRFIFNWSNAS